MTDARPILPDLNLAVYAYNEEAPQYERAAFYWRARMQGSEPMLLTSVVLIGFVRIVTNRALLSAPYPMPEALAIVEEWLARPNVVRVEPGPAHFALFADLMRRARGGHRLTTDAHLAALALERGAVLHSHDRDFARWPELDWRDPLG